MGINTCPDYPYIKLPIGTKVKIISTVWGQDTMYNEDLINKFGIVVDHDDDFYTPCNVVEVSPGFSYFLFEHNLEIVTEKQTLICNCGAKFTSNKNYHYSWCGKGN